MAYSGAPNSSVGAGAAHFADGRWRAPSSARTREGTSTYWRTLAARLSGRTHRALLDVADDVVRFAGDADGLGGGHACGTCA